MWTTIETGINAYLTHWHGAPTDPTRQHRYYRCEACRSIVTWKQIKLGGCRSCQGSRVRAAGLNIGEKIRLLIMPWSV